MGVFQIFRAPDESWSQVHEKDRFFGLVMQKHVAGTGVLCSNTFCGFSFSCPFFAQTESILKRVVRLDPYGAGIRWSPQNSSNALKSGIPYIVSRVYGKSIAIT